MSRFDIEALLVAPTAVGADAVESEGIDVTPQLVGEAIEGRGPCLAGLHRFDLADSGSQVCPAHEAVVACDHGLYAVQRDRGVVVARHSRQVLAQSRQGLGIAGRTGLQKILGLLLQMLQVGRGG